MLDGVPLSEKLAIAQEWLRRSQSGEFEFTVQNRRKFAELVQVCAAEATALVEPQEHRHPVPAEVYVTDEQRPRGDVKDMVVEPGSNVLRLVFGSALPKGGAR
jgi:hypothetical protein